jgi:hypothetical protein
MNNEETKRLLDFSAINNEETKRLRALARKIPNRMKRLQFLLREFEARMRFYTMLFEDTPRMRKNFSSYDDSLWKRLARKRGDKTKLLGGQSIEELAVVPLKERKRQLRIIGTPQFEIEDQARKEIAPHFGIKAGTFENWEHNVRRRRQTGI